MDRLQNVLIDLAIAIVPIIGAYIIAFFKKKTTEIQSKIDNDEVNKYINIAYQAVSQSVASVMQTYVDALKKSGTFSETAQKEAFNKAKANVLAILGEEGRSALEVAYADVNAYLDSLIEQQVKYLKTSVPAIQ